MVSLPFTGGFSRARRFACPEFCVDEATTQAVVVEADTNNRGVK
jgi:hypothetical protein